MVLLLKRLILRSECRRRDRGEPLSTRLTLGVLVAAAVAVVPLRGLAQSPCLAPCVEVPGWQLVNQLQLRVVSQSVPPVAAQALQGDLRFEIAGGEVPDAKIEVDMTAGGKRDVWTMLVVSGRVLAIRGMTQVMYPWEQLEGTLLMLRLTRQLLGRAFPAGLGAVGRSSRISLRDDQRGFRVGGDTYLDVWPPWSVQGSARRPAPDRVSFDMEMEYGTAEPGQSAPSGRRLMRLVGEWVVDAKMAAPPDAMSLAGWKIVPRGTSERTFQADSTPPYATLGELRRALLP